MAFPDRIERSVELAHPPDRVRAALTTAEGLSAWFGEKAAIDLRWGGAGRMRFGSGLSAEMRVERAVAPRVFAFPWRVPELPEGDPRRTYIEFTLEPVGAGTRLRLAETGFAQLPDDMRRDAYDSPTQGWASELGELAGYFDAAGHRGDRRAGVHRAGPTRRAILAALAAAGPATATDLAGRLPITRQAIAKHLVLLAEAGLLATEPGSGAGCATGSVRPVCRWRSGSWRRWATTGTAVSVC